jgi:hypothetical protein
MKVVPMIGAGAMCVAAVVASASYARSSSAPVQDLHPDIYSPADIAWKDGPPSLPKGAKIAVLEGDPGKEGPFLFRVRVPAGYRIPPHMHPKTERVTILAGTFHLGMGDTFDQSAGTVLPVGTYGNWPAGMKHFVWVDGETIVQFHGMGPWSIQYVNPKDDPRNQ